MKTIFYIAVMGFVLRVLFITVFMSGVAVDVQPASQKVGPDAAIYNRLALGLLDGKGYVDARGNKTTRRPPLHPVFLALVYAMAGRENFFAVRVAQALLCMMSIYLCGLIAFKATGSRMTAHLAALLYATNPMQIFTSAGIMTETLFTFFLLLTMYLFVCKKNALAVGISLGLAALTRGTGMLFLPAVVLFSDWHDKKRPAVIVLGFIIALMPWTARNYYHFERIIPVSSNIDSVKITGLTVEWNKQIGAEKYALVSRSDATKTFAELVKKQPFTFIQLTFVKWLHFFSPMLADVYRPLYRAVGFLSFFPLLVCSLIWPFVATGKNRTFFYCCLTAIMIFSLSHAVLVSDIRFRIPTEPLFMIFTADVCSVLFTYISQRISHA